jgi:putative ABC transport system permease protein
MLVIAGSLLGTALITGSFIVGDTLDSSVRAAVYNQLGPIDELVQASDLERAEAIAADVEDLNDRRIDGVTTMLGMQASVVHGSGDARRSEPEAQVLELDFEAARSFGGDPEATGISGATPSAGEAAISDDLAANLRVTRGDTLTAYLFGNEVDLTIARILPRTGMAGFWQGEESTSSNVFVAPGTIESASGAKVPGGSLPPTAYVLVSNRGDVEGGVGLTDAVTEEIEGLESMSGLRVEPVKEEGIDIAETSGKQFSEVFLGIGSFAVLAGILLLVNIFVMLSEERKSQLGMLRAVGMRRSDLIRMFVIEGTIYTLVSSFVGAILGIGVGWAIAKLAAPIFGGFDEFALELRFDMDLASLIGGYCLGALISWVTILFTSFRISRINIIAAIRDLPESKFKKTRKRSYVFGALAIIAGLAMFLPALLGDSPDQWAGALLGPPIIAMGALPFLTRAIGRRIAVIAVASFALFWGIFGNSLLGGRFFDSGEIFAFVLQGVLLTFSAVVLLSQTQENLEGVIRRVSAANLPLRLGIAYPLARRFRTALTLGMYSLVIFTMTFIAVLSNVFGGQVETVLKDGAGGYDIIASANPTNPPSTDELARVDGVDEVAALWHGGALFQTPKNDEPVAWPITGVDQAFVDGGPPALDEFAPGIKNDEEAWAALIEDPNNLIIDEFFLNESGGGPPSQLLKPGDSIEATDPITGKTVERIVIAQTVTDIAFAGSYASVPSVQEILGERVVPAWFWIQTDDSRAAEVAQEIQGQFFTNGVEADSFRKLVEDFQSLNLQFFQLMQGYLALGLLVGIAGLGVVMVRSVRERRREIGVLRALGFVAPQVRRAFLFESGFTAFEGIVIGVILALITAAQLVNSGDFGESAVFDIPWGSVGILTATSLVASLLATLWPARQAAEIPPAVALRIAD